MQETIRAAILEIDKKIAPLRNQANDLHIQITALKKQKEPIYAQCEHEWIDGEKEPWGPEGNSYQQLHACSICGKRYYSYSR
jgi:hypothetical protein